MSLYKKYRPSSIRAVMGNEGIKKSLTVIVEKEQKDRPHAFLLSGPTGCAKTTFARIMATDFGATATDIIEMNSSDFSGVDVVRDMLSKIQYAPLQSPCRVYILDECHRLSTAAQDTLLKMLEDGPDFVYFILCTTEKLKIRPAVRGRCTSFDVKPLKLEESVKLLGRIAKKERCKMDIRILEDIHHKHGGQVRDMIQLLEHLIAIPEEDRERELELSSEDTSDTSISELATALLQRKQWSVVAKIINEMENTDIKYPIMNYMQKVLLGGKSKQLDQAYNILSCFSSEFKNEGKVDLVLSCYEALLD